MLVATRRARYRKRLVQDRAREAQRVEKVLEDAGDAVQRRVEGVDQIGSGDGRRAHRR